MTANDDNANDSSDNITNSDNPDDSGDDIANRNDATCSNSADNTA